MVEGAHISSIVNEAIETIFCLLLFKKNFAAFKKAQNKQFSPLMKFLSTKHCCFCCLIFACFCFVSWFLLVLCFLCRKTFLEKTNKQTKNRYKIVLIASFTILLDYSRKNPNRGVWRHTFWKKTPGTFRFVTLLLEISDKNEASTPGNSTKLCYTHWNYQGQKSRRMEIPHDFFLITPGNSTSFCIYLRNFHILFIQYPWKFHLASCLNWILLNS